MEMGGKRKRKRHCSGRPWLQLLRLSIRETGLGMVCPWLVSFAFCRLVELVLAPTDTFVACFCLGTADVERGPGGQLELIWSSPETAYMVRVSPLYFALHVSAWNVCARECKL
ncbi:hypothetical protein COLO4_06960 [Corchorus olitorius]|uniref:Uncharacterized protein n=1 Tax=Corchorus olitorius TaxID=93759 RepID=A0A1R3KLC8_9ROSI|nr:hypothetical protein COLO4_06960 [Corchorus olitorius]